MRLFLLILAVLLVPIIPFVIFGAYLEPTIESWIGHPSLREKPVAVFIIVVLSLTVDILLPIPSSFVGTIAGQILGAFSGAVATWIGLNLSCALGYWLAAKWGAPIAQRFSKQESLEDVENLAERWGVWALVFCRALPVVAEASVLFAGLGRMPAKLFWPVVLAANLGLAVAYAVLGQLSVENGWVGLALAISLAVPVALLAGWLFTKQKRSRSTIRE